MCANITSPYLTTEEAAVYLRIKRRTLANMRVQGLGPPYRRHGGRIVYTMDDLDDWSKAARRRSTAERME